MRYSSGISLLLVWIAGLFVDYAPPAPTVVAHSQFPITAEAGDYILLGASITLSPGEYVSYHSHAGPDLVTVLEGEVIEHEPEGDRTVKEGDSWINQAGERHAVTNSGDIKAHLWASALLPKGDTSITPSAQHPLEVKAGEYDLISFVLDFAPGTGLPEQYHGGDVLFYVIDGEMMLLEKGATRQLKTYESWTEAPGAVYSVANASGNITRVAISMLLPKGAEETTLVSTPTPPATQEAANANVSPTPPATQDASNSSSQILLILIGIGLLILILAAAFYLRRAKS